MPNLIDNVDLGLFGNAIRKLALAFIQKGAPIVRYSVVIGYAARDIQKGELIQVDDVVDRVISPSDIYAISYKPITKGAPAWLSQVNYYSSILKDIPDLHLYPSFNAKHQCSTWATRLKVLVLPVVNCASFVADRISSTLRSSLPDSLSGSYTIRNYSGCGMDRTDSTFDSYLEYLERLIMHPNNYVVLLVSLGCEDANPSFLFARFPWVRSKCLSLSIQESGGTCSSINTGVELVTNYITANPPPSRQKAPYSALSLALQCGGSDSMSAVTANPLLGKISDFVVANDGLSVLSETPELYGNFEYLLSRCSSQDSYDALVAIFINWLDSKSTNISANPAPGNIQGGILNSIEKSLGSSLKGGFAPISHVSPYAADLFGFRGLTLSDSPGYDPVSATGQVLSGCNILLFSTGRGSCFGIEPIPSLKISSNSHLFNNFNADIDFDASSFISNPLLFVELLKLVIETANGYESVSEKLGYGQDEIVFWLDKTTN